MLFTVTAYTSESPQQNLHQGCTVNFGIYANIVLTACRHAPMCLKYMEKVQNDQNFRFCAIPQVMAIGTLALCFNNHKVFTGEHQHDRQLQCD